MTHDQFSRSPDRPRRLIPILLCVFVSSLPGSGVAAGTIHTDFLVVGGTESGCAAAIQAARMGVKSITLVNDIDWLGGQFTAEALVAIDENRGPSGYGHGVPFPRSGLFKEVIDRIEAHNLATYGQGRPGNTRVITTCRPSDAEQVFRELIRPHVESGQVRIISGYYPIEATVEGKQLQAIRFAATEGDLAEINVAAQLTIDASDWGDAIKVSGAAYEFGPDLQEKYGEPLAPTSRDDYPLTDMNPITYCMVLNETDEYKAIPAPPGYDRRNYTEHRYPRDPLWLYASRRVIDHYGFPEIEHPDVVLLCFPAFDYPLDVLPEKVVRELEATEPGASKKNIVEMTKHQRQIVFENAKQYSLGFLHYLQTEVHDAMEDQTHSFRRLELSDEFGTPDRMPPKPYVRESLRLKAMYMMRQQDTTGHGNRATNFATAMYHDGVACWQFEYDFHPTKRRFLDGSNTAGPWANEFREGRTWGPPYSGPSLFPLRSLVPEEIDGLLGAQKNLGYSSIVSSAVRLHDQSMAIGQAAGAVAAVSLMQQVEPREIPYDHALLSDVWQGLCQRLDGGEPQTLWPYQDLDPDHPAFEAINLLAVRRGLPVEFNETAFRADDLATDSWEEAVVELSLGSKVADHPPAPPQGNLTRGEFAVQWWQTINELPDRPFARTHPQDADSDGIADRDDPLLFDASPSSWPKYELPADEDGQPDLAADAEWRRFNFTGPGSSAVEGFTNDMGLPFDELRGYGWSRDMRSQHRRRKALEGEWRDTFIFTRGHDQWECNVPPGRYRVSLCIGDSDHEQVGQNVTVEGTQVLADLETRKGWFAERTIDVPVDDGRLTIAIGLPNGTTNTCLNWVQFKPLD